MGANAAGEVPVQVVEHDGVPEAKVSCENMWDLVEYLSFQRMHVKYDFKQNFFTVSFPNQSCQRSQEILNEWAARRASKPVSNGGRDMWVD